MYFNDKGVERSRDQEIEGMKENVSHLTTEVRDQKISSFPGSLDHLAT